MYIEKRSMLSRYRTYLSYSDRLHQDTAYLKSSRKLTEQILDRIVLQLNRVYPQVLSNKEAEKFRSLKTPLRIRLPDLLKHLQKKGERECQEFYRALQNNADNVYSTLPSRNSLNISDPVEICPDQEKIILNDRGPIFFLACFSVAAGLAFLLYSNNSEIKSSGAAKKDAFADGKAKKNTCGQACAGAVRMSSENKSSWRRGTVGSKSDCGTAARGW
ncbi:caspase recruitment domain-containing protein 19 isoform X2 [Hyperolius riggenbachi]|uniref:caspase recruitment domain-containing protein 19 isoform X2 n=1 Tax=Hyperolius riggenbachi TaxID=752182 RepID=UPI0035A2EEA0